jgi:hypothetical protein
MSVLKYWDESLQQYVTIAMGPPGPIGPMGPGVLVLGLNEAVPEGTLEGTVILRRTS